MTKTANRFKLSYPAAIKQKFQILKKMISFYEEQKVIKQTQTKNYDIDDYRNPPKKNIIGYRTKVIDPDLNGKRVLIRLALLKNGTTKAISKWVARQAD
jgi:hypothetical protein